MYTIPVVDDGILKGLITKSTLVTTLSKNMMKVRENNASIYRLLFPKLYADF